MLKMKSFTFIVYQSLGIGSARSASLCVGTALSACGDIKYGSDLNLIILGFCLSKYFKLKYYLLQTSFKKKSYSYFILVFNNSDLY